MESKLPEGCSTDHLPETGVFFDDRRLRPEQQVASQEPDTWPLMGSGSGENDAQPTAPKAITGTATVVRFRRERICRAMASTTRAEK
jgi:hypothetical protein